MAVDREADFRSSYIVKYERCSHITVSCPWHYQWVEWEMVWVCNGDGSSSRRRASTDTADVQHESLQVSHHFLFTCELFLASFHSVVELLSFTAHILIYACTCDVCQKY